ncbi:HNH endonuclease [Aminobacter aminovorans]|uniref:HNH endonuclease n=2 Tax=Aminobacter TaxID=31988 RepID=UPI0012AF0FF8|nr:restriction endonuclease [Aminobacter sp. MDW-2]QNH33975.1 HNH endonuclease [Aminobacter sp. MDW-2]
MPKLRKLRDDAYNRQDGHCWYCRRLMSPADGTGSSRCTAEHLLARCDGGKDTSDNVVAACWLCNSRRHRRKVPLSPESYFIHVRALIAKGRWSEPRWDNGFQSLG